MNKVQKILILLSIFFIIIIMYLFVLISTYKENSNSNMIINNTNNNVVTYEENFSYIEAVEEKIEKKLNYEKDRAKYYTIEALVNNYVNLAGNGLTENIKDLLSPNYIAKYGINSENLQDKLEIPKLDDDFQMYIITITDMLTAEIDEETNMYLVKGMIRKSNEEKINNINIMLEVDMINQIYNIYPNEYLKDLGLDKMKLGDSIENYKKEGINKNENNKFTYVTKSDLDVVNEYFSNLKELLLYYPDEAYSRLDTQYAEKRFGSKEKFINYIEENRTTIALMSINKYKIISKEEYVEYICSDKYDNIYILRQKDGIMNYTMFLDNYTIMHDEDIEYYNKLDKYDKATYNLRKFIEMVNTKDYNAIYSVLNNTFKSNNFSNVEQLKTYLKTNMYDINDIEIEDNDTSEYYIFNCIITNKRNESETKNMTIIIDQGEGTDFTMSFSFDS